MMVQKVASAPLATGHVGVATRVYGEGVRDGRDVTGNAKLSESTQKVRLPKSKAVKWSRRASRKASRSALQVKKCPGAMSQ